MGNLDEDEQKNLRKQTCSNLGDVFPREGRAKDGSMKAFGVFCSIKKGRREGGWEEPQVQRRLLMPVSHLLMIFGSWSQCWRFHLVGPFPLEARWEHTDTAKAAAAQRGQISPIPSCLCSNFTTTCSKPSLGSPPPAWHPHSSSEQMKNGGLVLGAQ